MSTLKIKQRWAAQAHEDLRVEMEARMQMAYVYQNVMKSLVWQYLTGRTDTSLLARYCHAIDVQQHIMSIWHPNEDQFYASLEFVTLVLEAMVQEGLVCKASIPGRTWYTNQDTRIYFKGMRN